MGTARPATIPTATFRARRVGLCSKRPSTRMSLVHRASSTAARRRDRARRGCGPRSPRTLRATGQGDGPEGAVGLEEPDHRAVDPQEAEHALRFADPPRAGRGARRSGWPPGPLAGLVLLPGGLWASRRRSRRRAPPGRREAERRRSS
jgi:hypothetical protein